MVKKPSASISKIIFSGGDEFELHPSDKILLVGANNSGKSQTLREIYQWADRHPDTKQYTNNLVVHKIELVKTGASNDLELFLKENAEYRQGYYHYENWHVHEHAISNWDNSPYLMNFKDGYIKNITADTRLQICNAANSIAIDGVKSKPQHLMYDDQQLMKNISNSFYKAFSKNLMINFRGGSEIPFHVGELPPEGMINQVSDEYVASVRKNALLHQQGDGMKSYAGILFETLVSSLDMTLLDEPEAFLHPPQMRKLGQTLAEEMKGQLIVATHSSDIMRGFLEGTKGNVRILRINRDGDKNFVNEAPPEMITKLWESPVLRYSNALEAVFHEQAIICEDDSDCRLYNAVADHMETEGEEPWQDTSYIPAGGKDGIKKIAEILRAIGVPTKAIFDFDFISERETVKSAIQSFGGKWDDFEILWKQIYKAINDSGKAKEKPTINSEIRALLEKAPDDLPRRRITEIMKEASVWASFKKHGSSGLPNGKIQKVYKEFKNKLESIGIFLVDVGEIESYCREISGHGPNFVNTLLSDKNLGDDELKDLRNFVKNVHHGKVEGVTSSNVLQ